jgi:hypothetical protein
MRTRLAVILSVLVATTAGAAAALAAPMPVLSGGALTGVEQSKPRLSFVLAARPGASLLAVNVELPPGLEPATSRSLLAKGVVVRSAGGAKLATVVSLTAHTVRIRLDSPRPSARFRLAAPALSVSAKLLEHVKSGVTKRLGLVVASRETGGKGARLPLVLPIDQ